MSAQDFFYLSGKRWVLSTLQNQAGVRMCLRSLAVGYYFGNIVLRSESDKEVGLFAPSCAERCLGTSQRTHIRGRVAVDILPQHGSTYAWSFHCATSF